MKHDDIYLRIQRRLSDYDTFEKMVRKHFEINYFSFVYQSLYNQIGYEDFINKKFNTLDFKSFLVHHNFLELVNEVYRTRLSLKGTENVKSCLQEVQDFDDYENALMIFEQCNPRDYKNGSTLCANAWSLGTKLLHFYNPQENPILDSVLRDNLQIGNMNAKLCIEFRKAANDFVSDNDYFFKEFLKSPEIKSVLDDRKMIFDFSKMGCLIWHYMR
ncbi:hypothetical protein [Methanococcoides sp. FTZ1]|uniref:hypothetical protein n=1 Tax=Methanococcoides sp. FTZ1 TaxID=3439061 RepID=UPI003F85A093